MIITFLYTPFYQSPWLRPSSSKHTTPSTPSVLLLFWVPLPHLQSLHKYPWIRPGNRHLLTQPIPVGPVGGWQPIWKNKLKTRHVLSKGTKWNNVWNQDQNSIPTYFPTTSRLSPPDGIKRVRQSQRQTHPISLNVAYKYGRLNTCQSFETIKFSDMFSKCFPVLFCLSRCQNKTSNFSILYHYP